MSEEMGEMLTLMFLFNLNHHNVTLVEFITGCSLCCFLWILLQPGSFLQGHWLNLRICLEHNIGDNQVQGLLATARDKSRIMVGVC